MGILDGFESYARVGGRNYKARISISATGWLAINSTAYKELGLDNYKNAEFYYNKASKMVGIKFVSEEQEGMYEMNPREIKNKEKALYMSIKGFVQNYKIVEQEKTQKYEIFKKEIIDKDLIVLLKPIINKNNEEVNEGNETQIK